ncbi:MAG: hypothetical protein KDA53_11815 [Hyphomonas sp.]|nr:hypothetical protein [Hyphomonas sp.]
MRWMQIAGAGAVLAVIATACTATEPVPGPVPGPGPVIEPDPVEAKACTMTGAKIINLSQDQKDHAICDLKLSSADEDDVVACIADWIEDNIAEECRGSYDIYVPGTAAEHGAWKQFNAMFDEANGRAHISLQYQDDTAIEPGMFRTDPNLDPLKYDEGVRDGRNSLRYLLKAIRTKSDVPGVAEVTDVRVFGHSKGSHSVAMTAIDPDPDYNYAEFYAFAQPGRTDKDIDALLSMPKAPLGRPGYMEKLAPNLIGITYANDEVQYYTGLGPSGVIMPEIWAFPGLIKDTGPAGFSGIGNFRIDHHNNYGGDYEDGAAGLKADDWRLGKGQKEPNFPYCAAGSKASWSDKDAEGCSKRAYRYTPWFWGNETCRQMAFDMMQADDPSPVKIGNSGPRGANCSEAGAVIDVSASMKYYVNLHDDNRCDYNLKVSFQSPGGGTTYGDITVKERKDQDKYIVSPVETMTLPNEIRIRIDADMVGHDENWIDKCNQLSASTAYIKHIKLTFRHPGHGRSVTRYVVRGWNEGDGVLDGVKPVDKLTSNSNTGWRRINYSGSMDSWDLFQKKNALAIQGKTEKGRKGTFYKTVYLVD